MADFRRDFETDADYLARIAGQSGEEAADAKVVDRSAAVLPSVVAKPGNYYARLAWEQGLEDEYSNAMKRRYGGEW